MSCRKIITYKCKRCGALTVLTEKDEHPGKCKFRTGMIGRTCGGQLIKLNVIEDKKVSA